MEYPFVTVTDAGADLLASTNGDPNNSLVIDKAVFSNQKSNTNKPLEQLTPSDFADPLVYQITTVKHHQNTIQPEVTLDNKNFQQNYPIYMIGILAHAENDNSGNETLYAVEEASNDPMIMPKATDNDFNCTFGIPIGISRSQDVNIVTTEAGTVSDKDFKDYKDSMDSQLASSAANQVADSSSLTNLSQSASYNSSNIGSLTSTFSSASHTNSMAMSLMNGVETYNESSIDTMYQSIQSNSADITTMKGKLSNVANNTSVSTAISNVSNSASTNSSNINSLNGELSSVSANSSSNDEINAINEQATNDEISAISERATNNSVALSKINLSDYAKLDSLNSYVFNGTSQTKSGFQYLDLRTMSWGTKQCYEHSQTISPGTYYQTNSLKFTGLPDGLSNDDFLELILCSTYTQYAILISYYPTPKIYLYCSPDFSGLYTPTKVFDASQNYVSNSELSNKLSNYLTSDSLNGYQTTSDADNKLSHYVKKSDLATRLVPHTNIDMNSISDGTYNGTGVNISHGPIDMSADDVQIYIHTTDGAFQEQKIIDYSRNNIYIRDYLPDTPQNADGMNCWYVFTGTQIKPNS